jgi:hypothetical protein
MECGREYGAVYNFGPRWIQVSPADPKKLISGQPVLLESAKKAIIRFISENDPSISAIQEMSAQLTQVENIEQLEKILYEHANWTVILCGLSAPSKKQAALRNLKTLIAQLSRLLKAQRLLLLPVIENHQTEPDDPAKWEEVKQWSRYIHGAH